MSDQTVKLIKLLNEEKSCNEICQELNLSNKQLFNNLTNLRNKGLFLQRLYHANGEIVYRPINDLETLKNINDCNKINSIILKADEQNLRTFIISDLHYGNSKWDQELISKVFEYCVANDIHIILCCGDLIDGSFGQGIKTIDSLYEQIDFFVKHYPFDKNILTFAVGGDHDLSGLTIGKQSIIEITNNYRHDIIINGFNTTYIALKNDLIRLFHSIKGMTVDSSITPSISFNGHGHNFEIPSNCNVPLTVRVPSISNICTSKETLPTGIDMECNFENEYIKDACFKQIYFGDKVYILNELEYKLPNKSGNNHVDDENRETNKYTKTKGKYRYKY